MVSVAEKVTACPSWSTLIRLAEQLSGVTWTSKQVTNVDKAFDALNFSVAALVCTRHAPVLHVGCVY